MSLVAVHAVFAAVDTVVVTWYFSSNCLAVSTTVFAKFLLLSTNEAKRALALEVGLAPLEEEESGVAGLVVSSTNVLTVI